MHDAQRTMCDDRLEIKTKTETEDGDDGKKSAKLERESRRELGVGGDWNVE